MGGLPCAKQIIDQMYALIQSMGCMNASILLYHEASQPTQEMADEFQAACNNVAKVAAKIQRHVTTGGEY